MQKKNRRGERGVALLEYGFVVGATMLMTVAMLLAGSHGTAGIWNRTSGMTVAANGVSGGSSAAAGSGSSGRSVGCMAGAHGESKICSPEKAQ